MDSDMLKSKRESDSDSDVNEVESNDRTRLLTNPLYSINQRLANVNVHLDENNEKSNDKK